MRRALLLSLYFLASAAWGDTIAIIGTGDVAGALGPSFAAQGHEVVYGSRDPERDNVKELVARTGKDASATTQAEAAADADIVVLAVPGLLVEDITKSLGDLSDKIIIDPTNPLDGEWPNVYHANATSNAEIIQAAAPGAHVVKAFSTLNSRTMVEPKSSGGPVSILLVGDSGDAKQTVADLVEGMGLEPIDLGGIDNARWVEGMAIVFIKNNFGDGTPFDFHLRKTSR